MNYGLKRFCCMVLGLSIVLAFATTEAADFGPLQTTNRFPLHMLVLTPRPVNAGLPDQGVVEATLAVEYSNTFFDHRNERWDVLIDTEVLIAELSMICGLTEKLAVKLDAPMISMQGGFLDGFLENFHDFLGLPNYDRENRPKNDFAYRVAKDDRLWLQGESGGLRVGDARFSAQYALPSMTLVGRPFRSSVLATVKTPTGDADTGLGSGRFDFGFFLPAKWRGTRWSFHVMPGFIWVDDPQTSGARVSARNSTSLFACAAYEYNQRWRWLAQLNYYSSPFEKSGLDELDDGALELVIGFQRTLSKMCYWEFAFSEDLTLAVPDFNIRIGMTWRLSIK